MTETIEFRAAEIVTGPDGQRYEMVVTGTADLTRGPLGRFLDLAAQITSEGLEVPPEIAAVLAALQEPQE